MNCRETSICPLPVIAWSHPADGAPSIEAAVIEPQKATTTSSSMRERDRR